MLSSFLWKRKTTGRMFIQLREMGSICRLLQIRYSTENTQAYFAITGISQCIFVTAESASFCTTYYLRENNMTGTIKEVYGYFTVPTDSFN